MSHFEIVRTNAGWHSRLVADNGRILMSSEVYPRRDRALTPVACAFEAAGVQMNKPPTQDPNVWPPGSRGRILGIPTLLPDEQVTFELREVDERYVPPPVELTPPLWLGEYTDYDVSGEGLSRRVTPRRVKFWHDNEYHYRNCLGPCDVGIPPIGAEVRSRMGSATFKGTEATDG